MASIHTKSCASSLKTVSNLSWHMGQGALDKIGSLGTGMYLVLGSFFAAAVAAEALEASEPAGPSFASSSTLSFDLIHSYDLMSIYALTTGIGHAYHLVHVPTSALPTSRRVSQPLVGPEMPVKVPSFPLSVFFAREETPTTGRALVRSCAI